MSFIQNLFTSRDNNANAETYVGQQDRIWWDPTTNAFYYSDGNTAGGVLITGGSSGNGTVGGSANSVQFNNAGNFGGDPNFTFSSANSTLSITNIVTTNPIVGGAGGANTQVLFNDSGNISGNARFTYNKASNELTQTGSAYLGNVFPVANNTGNIGSATSRFYDLWLGSGNINLIDDTLNINQEINAANGNLVISGGNGLVFGQFAMYGNTIKTINPTANINLGVSGDTGYVDIERPIVVNSTGGGAPAFVVEQNGTVGIFNANAVANSPGALNIVGSLDRAYQNVTNSGGMIHVTGPDNSATRITVDAYGVQGGVGATAAIVGRVGRGTASAPSAVQANDIMVRVGAVGWATTGFTAPTPAATNIEFVALENFTDTAQGTKITFNTANTGANSRSVSATVQANGVSFLNNTLANSGITFRDGTFQNTAFSPTSVVQSLTAGAGIALSASTGNITIQSTGVLGVNGTTNQINVGNVGNVLTLSLPQNFNTSANVQLYSLTVQDLIVLGNISNVIPSVVGGNIIYVANTATNIPSINNSGLVTGNVGNSAWAGILYNSTSNTWVMDIGNSVGITSDQIYSTEITANGNIHLGNAYNDYDFPNALLQGDVSTNSYGQYVLKNHFQGDSSSADIVAVANNGDDGNYYIDMGMNSNVYANASYAVTKANDGYLYVNGGNLVIGTQTAGKVINLFTGGTDNLNKIRGTISDTGLSMVGNVTANNMISTSATIGGTVSATGNITGGNVLVPSGIISASGNINGQNVNTTIVSASGNITGANIRTGGSVSSTGNIVGGNLVTTGFANVGNITTANITAGNITSAIISTTGNITGPNITATILSVSSILSVSGNITGGNLITGGLISTTGNVTANFFFGDGGQLSNISAVTAAKIANGTSQVNIPIASSNANITINGTSNVAVFATTGAYITGLISASGNITGGNLLTGGLISATSTITSAANITGGNILTGGLISSTGTITGTSHLGAVVSVTANITGGNILTGGVVSSTGNGIHGNLVGQNLTPTRVTFVGSGKEIDDDAEFTYNDTTNTLSVGNITATGNVNAAFFTGNGSGLTGTVGGSRYFGSFLSTTTQTNTSAGNALPMTFDTADAWNSGVQLGAPTPNSRIIMNNPGIYNIQFSAQLDKTDSGADNVDIWLSQDGVNVPNTNTTLTLSGNDDKVVAAWNFLVQTTTANSYFELYWTSIDTNLQILAQGTQINPTRPATPSIILTVTQA
jgi:hypothetical protein